MHASAVLDRFVYGTKNHVAYRAFADRCSLRICRNGTLGMWRISDSWVVVEYPFTRQQTDRMFLAICLTRPTHSTKRRDLKSTRLYRATGNYTEKGALILSHSFPLPAGSISRNNGTFGICKLLNKGPWQIVFSLPSTRHDLHIPWSEVIQKSLGSAELLQVGALILSHGFPLPTGGISRNNGTFGICKLLSKGPWRIVFSLPSAPLTQHIPHIHKALCQWNW